MGGYLTYDYGLKSKGKKPELTYKMAVIADLERSLASETSPNKREELQTMLDDWKGIADGV